MEFSTRTTTTTCSTSRTGMWLSTTGLRQTGKRKNTLVVMRFISKAFHCRFLLEAKDAKPAVAQPKLQLPSTVFATEAEEEEVFWVILNIPVLNCVFRLVSSTKLLEPLDWI